MSSGLRAEGPGRGQTRRYGGGLLNRLRTGRRVCLTRSRLSLTGRRLCLTSLAGGAVPRLAAAAWVRQEPG